MCACSLAGRQLAGAYAWLSGDERNQTHACMLTSRVATCWCICMVIRWWTKPRWKKPNSCVHAHWQGGNLLVPLHGYPVMNETKFPKRVDFNRVRAVSVRISVGISVRIRSQLRSVRDSGCMFECLEALTHCCWQCVENEHSWVLTCGVKQWHQCVWINKLYWQVWLKSDSAYMWRQKVKSTRVISKSESMSVISKSDVTSMSVISKSDIDERDCTVLE